MKIFSIFLFLLGAVSTAASNDFTRGRSCYMYGIIFSNMHDENGKPGIIDDAIVDFCTTLVPEDFEKGQKTFQCYPFPPDNSGNRVEIEISNIGQTMQKMNEEQCIYALKWLYWSCWCGGADDYSGFHFRIDPNAGGC